MNICKMLPYQRPWTICKNTFWGKKRYGCKWNNTSHTHPFGWLLMGCLFWNTKYFWNILNKSFFNFFKKKFKIFITLLCYGLHKKIAEIMSFSKKNQVHLQVLLSSKMITYNGFQVLLGVFHSFDWFQTFRIDIPTHNII